MKTILNWRTVVLAALCMLCMLFMLCESEHILHLIIIKLAGLCLAFVTYCLCKYWDAHGELNELNKLINDND